MSASRMVVRSLAALILVAVPAWQPVAAVPTDDPPVPACQEWGTGALDGTSVVGSPRRSIDGVPQAGVVLVTRDIGGTDGDVALALTSQMVGVPLQPKGQFGASVAVLEVTPGDLCKDLVIGMPGRDQGRGGVVVVPDFGAGLDPGSAAWLPTGGLSLEAGDQLGAAVAAGVRTLVAGSPGWDIPGAPNAGALFMWWVPREAVPSGPISVADPKLFVQGSQGVLGKAERGDRFGSVLWADFVDERMTIAVGIPREDIGRVRDAGAVALLEFDYPDPALTLDNNYLLWQGGGLPGVSRRGDMLGSSVWYSDLRGAYGVPGKDADRRRNSGAVVVSDFTTPLMDRRYVVVTQDTPGVPGRSERGDQFGASLAMWQRSVPTHESALAIGAPGEDLRGKRDVGSVTYLGFAGGRFDPALFSVQKVKGLAKGDQFGARLVLVDSVAGEQLLIGAPGEDRPGARNAGRYYGVVPNALARPTVEVFLDGVSRNERLGQ